MDNPVFQWITPVFDIHEMGIDGRQFLKMIFVLELSLRNQQLLDLHTHLPERISFTPILSLHRSGKMR
jgi:hypothetical protein